MDPIDDFLEKKEAGFFGDVWRGATSPSGEQVGRQLTHAAIGAGAALAAAAAVPAANKILGAITKRHDFKMMMESNPNLHPHLEENPKLFNQAYTSLRSLNPTFAKDPLVAGGLMLKIMTEPAVAPSVLTEAYRAKQRSEMSPMQGVMTSSFQKPGFRPEPPEKTDPFAEQRHRVQGLELSLKENKLKDEYDAYGRQFNASQSAQHP